MPCVTFASAILISTISIYSDKIFEYPMGLGKFIFVAYW